MASQVKRKLAVQQLERANVLGVGIHAIDMSLATSILHAHLQENTKGYVCLAGVHGIMEAQRNRSLKSIFTRALLVAPDGMPAVWMGRWQGFRAMHRVFGPDLMIGILGSAEFRECVHFFCGGEEGTAERLRGEMLGRFPWVKIAGTYSPPFREMTTEEESGFVEKIRALQPDIIWVGLSTPKQECFMAQYLPMLDTKLMIGVGAAFLFHTGAIKDSPNWVKRAGLQWLHRLLQEPSRLWKRYLLNNPLFIVYSLLQILRLKPYALATATQQHEPYAFDHVKFGE
jgi:N-acetylglucosaminyldiphosphoundecaprenol N-acetyl-beta-D-mannosaminyltransferase